MLLNINACQIVKEKITGSRTKIKEKQSGNDPERGMCIDVHILFFFQKMIEVETADDNDAHGSQAITHKAICKKATVETFIEINHSE